MAAKKKAPKDTRPQSERFIEAAKLNGADESGKAFEKVLSKIAKVAMKKRKLTVASR
jgi:hypothetical protein